MSIDQLIAAARQRQMTPAEIEEQRISFAYGNAPEESTGTLDDVRAAAAYMRAVA